MVAKIGNEITDVPLSEVAGRLRLVTPDNDLVVQGSRMGISFGTYDYPG
jgi:6-phosphofructokinase 1